MLKSSEFLIYHFHFDHNYTKKKMQYLKAGHIKNEGEVSEPPQ